MDLAKRARELFLVAIDVPAAERDALLDKECEEDGSLREEVERLLEAHGVTESFLDRPLPTGALAEALCASLEISVDRVGPYRLIEELGRGGMGVVFRGVRTDGQFEQEVAVKVLSTLAMDDAARESFERERRILATLDHPWIATLFDGGVADGGAPYYVMQLVRGVPVDRYCDEKRLSVEGRLKLFLKICEAVQFAHGRRVVHLDLKPDNVLVTEDGSPRLMDFGIAALLADDAGGGMDAEGQLWQLTPDYASPEQIRGEPVTTASDVYSLGVVLHQLLAGQLPRRTMASPGEERAKGSELRGFESLSRRIRGAEGDEIARRRGTSARRLRRKLEGDLEAVVAKALCPDPEERYQHAENLAAELRLVLEGRPVEARPLPLWGRGVKLVSRHRLSSALVLLLAAVLFVSGAVLVQQYFTIRQERDQAEEVTKFLVGLFEVSDPSEARGRELSARDILSRGEERLSRDLAENPALRARLARTIGLVYQNLGLLDQAKSQLEQSLQLSRALYGPRTMQVARGLSELGNLERLRGDLRGAERLLRQASALWLELAGPRAIATASAENDLSMTLTEEETFDEAEELVRDGLRILRRYHPRARSETAALSITLGVLYLQRGDLDEAEKYLRTGRELRQDLGEDHPRLAQAENNLGETLRRAGRLKEAEELLTHAVASRRRLLGDHHPDLAASLTNLALVRVGLGDLEGAQAMLEEAQQIDRQALGVDHSAYAAIVNNLGAVAYKRGDLDTAEQAFRETLALGRRKPGAERSETARALQNLGVLVLARGRVDEAIGLLEKALSIRLKVFGPIDERVASTKGNLAVALMDRGDTARAEQLLRESLAALDATLPESQARRARVRTRLAQALMAEERFEEAEPLLRDAESMWTEAPGDHDSSAAESRSLLAECRSSLGKREPARSHGDQPTESVP